MQALTVALALSTVALASAATKCGQTPIPPNVAGKIVGGTVATPYSWPWQIEWCENGWFGCSLECGGTVVAEGWVVTAGHCVYGSQNSPSQFRVKTGVFSEDKDNEVGEAVHKVKKIHLHPQYNPNPDPVYDIALIELADKITFNNHTQPICLPSKDDTVIVPPNTAWATGWGTTTEDGDISKKLRQVNVPFVDYKTCEAEYPGTITEKVHVCAGVRGEDTCQGDSGGPLVVQSKSGAWFQYGITSFGEGCAENKHPGIYSRVTAYCDWIKTETSGAVSCQDPSTY
uniref:limulus clotting factor C n=1 Tax=Panagrellus redivivus TaxID=6233 RepID=A0A7E4ZT85_PANRE